MILVTTPNGKVGENVARELLERGLPVRVGAHTPDKARAAFPGAEIVPFDYANEESVAAAVRGVTALYLASPGSMTAAPVNRAVDLAMQAGVGRVVRLSAMGVEHGESPLREVERHVENSGLEWTFLRPSWFLQNYSTIHRESIRRENAIREPSGDGRTAFVDARDIAAVGVAALTGEGHAGRAYAITGPAPRTRFEVAEAISAATGKVVRYEPISDEQFRAGAAAAGLPAAYVELMSFLYGSVRAGQTEEVTGDVEAVLGRPPIALEAFVQDYRETWL